MNLIFSGSSFLMLSIRMYSPIARLLSLSYSRYRPTGIPISLHLCSRAFRCFLLALQSAVTAQAAKAITNAKVITNVGAIITLAVLLTCNTQERCKNLPASCDRTFRPNPYPFPDMTAKVTPDEEVFTL